MRIDFHQHFFPYAPPYHDEAAQQWLHTDSRVQDYADVDAVLTALDAAQIDVAVLQGEYLLHQHNCVARNTAVLAACARAPHRLQAFAMVQPRHPQAIDEIARCRAAGMRGVGELNPAIQQFSLRDRAVQRVIEYCAYHAIPMLFHVNEPVGRAYPGKSTTPLVHFYEIAARYPELRMILAHWGGGLLWYETMPAVQRVLANVFYDTAASPLLFPDTHQIVQMALLAAPDKIVFGSDFPLRLRPAQAATIAPFVAQIATAIADDAVRTAWLGGTAQTLLTAASVPIPHVPRVPRGLPITVHTAVVALVEHYPDTLTILAEHGIHVDEYTPWWQSLLTAATMIGMPPERLQSLIHLLHQATTT